MRRHSSPSRRAPDDVIFGVNPVLEALRASPGAVAILYLAAGTEGSERLTSEAHAHGVAVEVTDRAALDRLTAGGNHQGVAARARPIAVVPLEDLLSRTPPLVVIADGITDPQNLGAIIRSAEVLGAGGIILPRDRSAGITPAVVRASSGAAMHLAITQVVNLVRATEQAKAAGYWIVGLDASSRTRFQDLPALDRVALVVGSEDRGMRPLVARTCDFVVAIPVRGRVTSLNASAAAAIALHEIAMRLPSRP